MSITWMAITAKNGKRRLFWFINLPSFNPNWDKKVWTQYSQESQFGLNEGKFINQNERLLPFFAVTAIQVIDIEK